MKIPTPGGHAFILRRLDTEAISLTTMFRATYPQATEDAEKAEIGWIKNNYELSGANKTGRARFAGTWASIEVAMNIADTYSISHLLPALTSATPDPTQVYSKTRGKSTTQQLTPQPTPPSPPKPTGPNKRRKEGTPQPTTRGSPAPAPTPAPAPITSPVPTPRRSTRLKSPAAPVPLPLSPRRTPKLQRPRVEPEETQVPPTPATPEVTHVEEEEAVVAMEPNMAEDIQEQRELIAGLKAQRAATIARGEDQADTTPSLKRTIEEVEPPLTLNPRDPEAEPRAVATNSRIRFLRNSSPQTKSVFWGVAAFAAGVGAV